MPTISKSHDLNLPDWGPYSKEYAGVSHIPDVASGLRFDVSIMPGYFRQAMIVPNERCASGHHAWEAASDLSYYAFRYQIEWKDKVYCNVSFSEKSASERLIRCEFVNDTHLHQNLMMHIVANLNFPPREANTSGILRTDNIIHPAKVTLPCNSIWVDALEYTELTFANPRPTDNLVHAGWVRAEIRDDGFVNDSAIGRNFGRDTGDQVLFEFKLDESIEDAILRFRFRLPTGGEVSFDARGERNENIVFSSDTVDEKGFGLLDMAVGQLAAGLHKLKLVSLGGSPIDIDGFVVAPRAAVADIGFESHIWQAKPSVVEGPGEQCIILKYADTDVYYGLAWDHSNQWIREFVTDHLDLDLRYLAPNNYSSEIDVGGRRHFTDIFLRPIELDPHMSTTQYALTCSGTLDEVRTSLTQFLETSTADNHSVYEQARQKRIRHTSLPAGETFRFSQNRMAATELLNIVYPVYTRRQYIRHFCPGKWWDSLYTWDSGFIGHALLEYHPELSIDNMNAYLTEPGDDHAAFVNHGTLIPTQIYQFHEIWNRTQDMTFLEKFYPKVRQYYRFLAGHAETSQTTDMKSNLIRTWNIFRFDSGGWDDYPAQEYTLEHGIDDVVACSALTAHVIRAAKILYAAALSLGIEDDVAGYLEDVELLTRGLQEVAWDEDAGYFSYVVHDKEGNPIGPLRDENGLNFNMGLDGVMPLFAGICTPEQEELFFNRLADPHHFWTRIGISTVDQSAPYYRSDGYWNGAVWMPHQWFIWKTALDQGRGEFAYQIAETALELWKSEVEASYYCFEHFLIESGRGAGWHQFGALSSPVVSWFSAYHRPGRLSTGMDIWVLEQAFSESLEQMNATLKLLTQPKTVTVIVNMQANRTYTASWNDKPVHLKQLNPGSFQIDLTFDSDIGRLQLTSC